MIMTIHLIIAIVMVMELEKCLLAQVNLFEEMFLFGLLKFDAHAFDAQGWRHQIKSGDAKHFEDTRKLIRDIDDY